MGKRLSIVVLGANGQVGTEVCLYLSLLPDAQVTGLVRAKYNAVLLDLAGIAWDVLDYQNISTTAAAVLGQADAVFDCTFPAGQQQQLADLILGNAESVMRAMRKDAVYIHSSSISAFGMPMNSPELKNYRFARTGYARVKRLAESRISTVSRRYGVRTCHLRLGQVHGVLQSVTRQLWGLIEHGGLTAVGTADSLSNVVFAHSVALACQQAAAGFIADGQIETVVASPQWNLETLYKTYGELFGQQFEVRYQGGPAGYARSSVVAGIIRLGRPFRSVLEAQILPLVPGIAPRMKGLYRVHEVLRDRSGRQQSVQSSPVYNLTGPVPGHIVKNTHSSPSESIDAFRRIQARLEEILQLGVSKGC